MKERRIFSLGCLIMSVIAAPVSAQQKITPNAYYPTKDGTRWIYKTTAGDRTARIEARIVTHEAIGGVMCVKMQAATLVKNDVRTRIQNEHVHVSEKGAFRYAANNNNLTPPLQFLAFPPKKGTTWKINSRSLGLEMKGTFKIEEQQITVPAGKFKAIVCRSEDFTIDGKNVPHTYYFASGVGLIKQEVEYGGQTVDLELEKFVAAKKSP